MEEKFYALYIRVSTEAQAGEDGSLLSQEQRIKEYLQYQKIDSPYIVYVDTGTGKDTKRMGYREMMSAIEAGKIKAVVCTELSRVSRSVADFQNFLHACKKYDVDFVSLREKFDSTTSHGKLTLAIFSSLAQFESEQISERTSANLKARAKRGLFNGGFIYGYRPIPGRKGYIEVEENEARTVQSIYERYLACGSYSKVTDWLNASGYSFRNGRKWHKNTVLMILKNSAYIAKRRIDSEIVSMSWKPIVSMNTWEEAQTILKRNYGARCNYKQSPERHCFLFRGLIYCGYCENLLEACSGINHQGKKYFYYRHSSKSRKPGCDLRFCYPAEKIEDTIHRNIVTNLKDDSMIESICNAVQEKIAGSLDDLKREARSIEKELEEINVEANLLIKTVYWLQEGTINGFVTPKLNALAERKAKIENRLKEIKAELYRLEIETIRPESIKEMASFLEKEFVEMEEEEKQKILHLLVDRIEIHGGNLVAWMRAYNNIRDLRKVRAIPDWLPEQDLNL